MADEELNNGIGEASPQGASTATAPVKKSSDSKRKPKQLPPYRVLLHNDDVSSFDRVIQSILELTPLAPQEAVLRTIEAHETGVSLLLTTHRERAELYVEQFASFKITVTTEPAEA